MIRLLLIALLVFAPLPPQQNPAADLILYNGVVWTADEKNPTAEAIAIKGNKILYVGKNDDTLKFRKPQTRAIDLKGRFVVPGFNDNHVHFASAAQFLEFNIMRVSTQEEFVARVKEVVSACRKMSGYWAGIGALTTSGPRAVRAVKNASRSRPT